MKYHMSMHNILHFAVEQPPGSTMRLEFFNLNRLCSINHKERHQDRPVDKPSWPWSNG